MRMAKHNPALSITTTNATNSRGVSFENATTVVATSNNNCCGKTIAIAASNSLVKKHKALVAEIFHLKTKFLNEKILNEKFFI